MVYTKAYKMHNIRKLKQSKEYIKNASKTTVNLKVQTITWIIFQQVPQKVFQTISDKHAATAGAKIIVPNPRNTPAKYTKWQVDQLFKRKSRLVLIFIVPQS